MYSRGNIDVRNWVHLFESPCINVTNGRTCPVTTACSSGVLRPIRGFSVRHLQACTTSSSLWDKHQHYQRSVANGLLKQKWWRRPSREGCIVGNFIFGTFTEMWFCVQAWNTGGTLENCGIFKLLTLRRLMSYIYIYIYIYIYGAPILDVSRSHTTTQHSR